VTPGNDKADNIDPQVGIVALLVDDDVALAP
jgi:hypothetical protein